MFLDNNPRHSQINTFFPLLFQEPTFLILANSLLLNSIPKLEIYTVRCDLW